MVPLFPLLGCWKAVFLKEKEVLPLHENHENQERDKTQVPSFVSSNMWCNKRPIEFHAF